MRSIAFDSPLLKFKNDMTQLRHFVAPDRVSGVHALREMLVHSTSEP
jgi:hypothetical protein